MVKVTIADNKFIPTIGKGPITEPIAIENNIYRMLIKCGYKVKVVREEPTVIKVLPETPKAPVEDVKVTDDVVKEDEVIEETEVETDVDVTEDDAEVEDEVVETEEVEEVEETPTTDWESMTNKELKVKLDEMGVEYKYNDNKATLVALVMNNLTDDE